jgi:hypothetical protein
MAPLVVIANDEVVAAGSDVHDTVMSTPATTSERPQTRPTLFILPPA